MKRARGSMGESEVETWTRMLSFSLRTSPLRNHSRVEHHFHSGNFSFVSLLDRALVDYASKLSTLEVVKTSSLRASYKIHVPPLASQPLIPEKETRYTSLLLFLSPQDASDIFIRYLKISEISSPHSIVFSLIYFPTKL